MQVPVGVCKVKNHLVSAVDANGIDVLSMHPSVCNVRVTFKDKWCLHIFFDLGTTGSGIYQAQIIRFDAVCALSRPGSPLELLGTYTDFVLCKMKFPEDAEVKTGIKRYSRPGSQMRGAPTLSEVNKKMYQKIVGWRKVIFVSVCVCVRVCVCVCVCVRA